MKELMCEKCNRSFTSQQALDMHNNAKHGGTANGKRIMSYSQKKKLKKYAIYITLILIIAGIAYWKITPPKNGPIIELEPTSYNFGPVSQARGTVSTKVTVKNTGNEPLILSGMETSCGCTSAKLIKDGVESPRFGMEMANHPNPKDWRATIAPGESAQLEISYDPNVHKDLRGQVRRDVTIFSNAARESKKLFTITANQVN